jgi:predicted RND superfamily exporter protein
VRYAFTTVGMALFVTSVILVAGFLVLTFSAFEINAGMGKLCALTLAVALAADYLMLPPLLMKLEGSHEKDAAVRPVAAVAPAGPGGNSAGQGPGHRA